MNTLEYALRYAEEGLAVFPTQWIEDGQCSCGNIACSSPGKHPILGGGFKIASMDAETIKAWWNDYPNANVAIATGEVSGVFVIDVDVANGKSGAASLKFLETEVGSLPKDALVKTGSGGLHIYLKMHNQEINNSASKIAEHIDVRANGGYVIAPPSTHKSGFQYEWMNEDV
ncbi:bifunctional DNA primase/polymerase [Roseobacter sp. N2S]|uniref:bifunctional DNA primase/polymerase n=1 Tax=Roseobacter sp. N2S TaxID=2663844 RepID=UPI002860B1AC|nr:bifunctional DNA primase/polymerase [Roseobacter sp. N2S]MDR6266601.1 putative DNA primase/helicase [Roseobacter sp. N2S]